MQPIPRRLPEPGQELATRLLRVVLDLDDQVRIPKPNPIPNPRAVYGHVVMRFQMAHCNSIA
jgi:hypothetical protein